MKLSYSSKSDIGLVREVNQDRWTHVNCDWGDLFVVADGLGHKDGGQFASQTIVNLFKEKFSEKDPGEIPGFLRHTIEEANTIIHHQKMNEYSGAMMGSTCVALVIQGNNAYIAHVGDSRIYHLHGSELTQLTKDHSLVQRMVDDGLISKEQAEKHPNKNVLTEAVGAETEVNVEARQEPLRLTSGDKFLLCSDGLWGLISHDDLYEILSREKPETATDRFIDLAKQNGGYDNITAQVIHFKTSEGSSG
ncbi:MAG: Stp1/IreP family PP2C-type Ser/Thr phosphatase [Candidatus Marinimicrobia bacterium]|nr:Stp1/IreP family PP2C-type Ser/Thr phosphatase [Candidatus Neomarinimicrobiota bacterium]